MAPSPAMTRQGLSKRGFTLFELLFVSVLIAAISTIVLPRVSSSMGLNTKTGVLKVAGFLENGYQKAVLSHQTLRVTIDLEKGEYWADTVNNQDPEIPLIDENTKLDDVLLQFQKNQRKIYQKKICRLLKRRSFRKLKPREWLRLNSREAYVLARWFSQAEMKPSQRGPHRFLFPHPG